MTKQVRGVLNLSNIGYNFDPDRINNLSSFFEKLSLTGINLVELRFFENNETLVNQSVEEIKSNLKKYNFSNSIHAPWNKNLVTKNKSEQENVIEIYKRTIFLAGELDSEYLVLHGGEDFDTERGKKEFRQIFIKLLSYARKNSVLLAVENDEISRPTIFKHPKDFIALNDIDSGFKFVLDLGHANTMNYDFEDFFPVMGKNIIAFHFHDNKGNSDNHFPIGEGNIPWEKNISLIKKNFDIDKLFFILEVDNLEHLEFSVKKLKKFGLN